MDLSGGGRPVLNMSKADPSATKRNVALNSLHSEAQYSGMTLRSLASFRLHQMKILKTRLWIHTIDEKKE